MNAVALSFVTELFFFLKKEKKKKKKKKKKETLFFFGFDFFVIEFLVFFQFSGLHSKIERLTIN